MRLIFLYLDYRFGAKFNSIKSKTSLLSTNANLSDLFNHVVNLYHVEYKEKGLSGIYKLRQSVLAQINGLTISKFWHKDRKLEDAELQSSLKSLYIFKDVLSNIKYTIELLTLFKTIVSVISNAAFIPFFVLALWALIRGALRWTSYLFTGFMTKSYLSSHPDFGTKFSAITDWLRIASMNIHNWLFGDNLIPAHQTIERGHIPVSANYNIFPKPVKHSYLDCLPTSLDWIDWTILAYTTGGLIILGTTLAIYTGAIDPISLSKRIGGLITAYFLGTDGSGDDDNGGGDDGGDDPYGTAIFDVDDLDSDDDDDGSQIEDGTLLTPRQREDIERLKGLPILPKEMGGEDNWRDSSSTPSSSKPIAPDYVAPDWKVDTSGNPYNKDFADTLDSPERSEYNHFFKTPNSSPVKPVTKDDSSDEDSDAQTPLRRSQQHWIYNRVVGEKEISTSPEGKDNRLHSLSQMREQLTP